MQKRMVLVLWMGVIGAVVGIILAIFGFTPKSVPALITAISAAWIGIAIAARFSKGVRDEMVVRVEHISAYYAFNGTLYLIFALMAVRTFLNLSLGTGDLLLTLALFMCFSYLLLKYVLLRRGLAE